MTFQLRRQKGSGTSSKTVSSLPPLNHDHCRYKFPPLHYTEPAVANPREVSTRDASDLQQVTSTETGDHDLSVIDMEGIHGPEQFSGRPRSDQSYKTSAQQKAKSFCDSVNNHFASITDFIHCQSNFGQEFDSYFFDLFKVVHPWLSGAYRLLSLCPADSNAQ